MKRLLMAVAISIVIVSGWNMLAAYMGWLPQPSVTPPPRQPEVVADKVQEPAQSVAQQATKKALNSTIITVDTPLYRAEFLQDGAILRSFILKEYTLVAEEAKLLALTSAKATTFGNMGLLVNAEPTWGVLNWEASTTFVSLEQGTKQITFVGKGKEYTVERIFTFYADTYAIEENTRVTPLKTVGAVQVAYTLDATPINEMTNYDVTRVVWSEKGSITEIKDTEELDKGKEIQAQIDWAGVMDRYFLLAVMPVLQAQHTTRIRKEDGVFRVALYEMLEQKDGAVPQSSVRYWLGPKQPRLLKQQPNNLVDSINYGFFSFLSKPLLLLLEYIYKYVQNYGVAIILLTLIIKIIFWPLSKRSFASMKKMREIQPLIEGVREKYKDNKEEMNKEIMRLYKMYNVNPLGGCLPLLVQIPVFFALYEVLLNAIALRHAAFIATIPFTDISWLTDLSAKDPFYITPIAMGISMFIQQLITPAIGDPVQRKIMLAMPLVFTVFFLNFPSGLVIYWLFSNIFSILQQWAINRPAKA